MPENVYTNYLSASKLTSANEEESKCAILVLTNLLHWLHINITLPTNKDAQGIKILYNQVISFYCYDIPFLSCICFLSIALPLLHLYLIRSHIQVTKHCVSPMCIESFLFIFTLFSRCFYPQKVRNEKLHRLKKNNTNFEDAQLYEKSQNPKWFRIYIFVFI